MIDTKSLPPARGKGVPPMITAKPRIAVVGATGAVGTTLLELIDERKLPHSHIDAVASDRSAGSTVPFAGGTLTVTNSTLDANTSAGGVQIARSIASRTSTYVLRAPRN